MFLFKKKHQIDTLITDSEKRIAASIADSRGEILDSLSKMMTKLTKTELICDDILENCQPVNADKASAQAPLCELLSLFDLTLRCARSSSDRTFAAQAELMEVELNKFLEEYKITRIDSVNIKVDINEPEIYNAAEPPSPELAGLVCETVTPGYKIDGQVVKKAIVIAYKTI